MQHPRRRRQARSARPGSWESGSCESGPRKRGSHCFVDASAMNGNERADRPLSRASESATASKSRRDEAASAATTRRRGRAPSLHQPVLPGPQLALAASHAHLHQRTTALRHRRPPSSPRPPPSSRASRPLVLLALQPSGHSDSQAWHSSSTVARALPSRPSSRRSLRRSHLAVRQLSPLLLPSPSRLADPCCTARRPDLRARLGLDLDVLDRLRLGRRLGPLRRRRRGAAGASRAARRARGGPRDGLRGDAEVDRRLGDAQERSARVQVVVDAGEEDVRLVPLSLSGPRAGLLLEEGLGIEDPRD